jgi:hypothetical protein
MRWELAWKLTFIDAVDCVDGLLYDIATFSPVAIIALGARFSSIFVKSERPGVV